MLSLVRLLCLPAPSACKGLPLLPLIDFLLKKDNAWSLCSFDCAHCCASIRLEKAATYIFYVDLLEVIVLPTITLYYCEQRCASNLVILTKTRPQSSPGPTTVPRGINVLQMTLVVKGMFTDITGIVHALQHNWNLSSALCKGDRGSTINLSI